MPRDLRRGKRSRASTSSSAYTHHPPIAIRSRPLFPRRRHRRRLDTHPDTQGVRDADILPCPDCPRHHGGRIHRVTIFKIPKPEDQQLLLEQYRQLSRNNEWDGKSYILSLIAGPGEEDSRAQGFKVISKTEFCSLEDMKYYDDECPEHKKLKAFAQTLTVKGIMTVYFKPQVFSVAAS